MREVALFAEDAGHEAFIGPLIAKVAGACGTAVRVMPRSVRGGHGRVISELREFLLDIDRHRVRMPDLLVVATDANCRGMAQRQAEIESVDPRYRALMVTAVPDPHIERWMLIDPAAFKTVLGRGCSAPDQKCERDRYKRLLIEAVRATGVEPLIGGIEHAGDIVAAMELSRAAAADASFERFISALRAKFIEWR